MTRHGDPIGPGMDLDGGRRGALCYRDGIPRHELLGFTRTRCGCNADESQRYSMQSSPAWPLWPGPGLDDKNQPESFNDAGFENLAK